MSFVPLIEDVLPHLMLLKAGILLVEGLGEVEESSLGGKSHANNS